MLLVTSVFIVRHFEKLVIIVCLRTWKIYLATCIGKVHLYLETANQKTDKENINLDFARVSYLDPSTTATLGTWQSVIASNQFAQAVQMSPQKFPAMVSHNLAFFSC
jgi:hypothetical protein